MYKNKKNIFIILTVILIITSINLIGCKPKDPPNIVITQGNNTIFPDSTYVMDSVIVGESGDIVTFTIENSGQLELNIDDIIITGANSNQYILEKTVPAVIKDDEFTFTIQFQPSTGGLLSADIEIESNSENNSTFKFKVAGSGTTGEINVIGRGQTIGNGGNFEFGNLLVISGSIEETLTIENIGNGDLIITEISKTNQDSPFTIGNINIPQEGLIIPEGEIETFSVTFDPSTSGSATDNLKIVNSDPVNSNFIFTVKGYGTESDVYVIQNVNVIENNGEFDFGNVIKGETSGPIPFRVGNLGTGDLTVSDISLSGADAALFTLDTTLFDSNGIIPPSSEKEFTIEFIPNNIGLKNSMITITNDNVDNNPYIFDLIANSVLSNIRVFDGDTELLNNNTYDFSDVEVNELSDSLNLEITNDGDGNLRIDDISISGTDAGEFDLINIPTFPVIIEPDDNLILEVIFQPTVEQLSNSVLTITSNSEINSSFVINMAGRGDNTPPGNVTNLSYYKGTGIKLSWNPPADTDLDKIVLSLSDISGTIDIYKELDPTITNYEFEYLPIGYEYDVLVKVYDKAGISSGEQPDGSIIDLPDEIINNIRFHIHDLLDRWGDNHNNPNPTFRQPFGIDIDSSGNIYVVDATYHLIQKFDSTGNILLKWGFYGTGQGEFDNPTGITIVNESSIEYVYIVDTYNHRVQKFDTDGNYILEWGENGQGDGQFTNPYGITSVNESGTDYIYVTDTDNHRIQKFTASGVYISQFGSYGMDGTGDGELNRPMGIISDSSGDFYIVENGNHRVQKFDASGNSIGWFGYDGATAGWRDTGSGDIPISGSVDGAFDNPIGIAISGGNLYISDSANNRIQEFDFNGNYLNKSAVFDECSFLSSFNDGTDHLYISNMVYDTVNGRDIYNTSSSIMIWDFPSGTPTDYIISDNPSGLLNNPNAMAVDSLGNMFVADTDNNRIVKYDFDGSDYSYSTEIPVNNPIGVAVSSSDNVYVIDDISGSRKARLFDNNLILINDNFVPTGVLTSPESIAVNLTTDNIYIADNSGSNQTIYRFASDGTMELNWGSYGVGNGEFITIRDIEISPVNGDVFVASTGSIWIPNSMVIQRFDSDGNFINKWANQYFLDQVKAISIDKDGNVNAAVVNSVQKIVNKYKPTGEFITTVNFDIFKQHHWRDEMDIITDSLGNMYFLDTKWDTILKLSE